MRTPRRDHHRVRDQILRTLRLGATRWEVRRRGKPALTLRWYRDGMDRSVGRRENARHSIWVPGQLRNGRGKPFPVEVVDLSETGCRINEKSIWFSENARVTISIGSLEFIPATVRWMRNGQMGLEFYQPLYGPVFDHLKDMLAGLPSVQERRQDPVSLPPPVPTGTSLRSRLRSLERGRLAKNW